MKRALYNVRHLHALREVHVRGTLAAAADALGCDPSTVSHQLAALERDVGARLLEPTGRNVRLTAPALLLVEHAEQILYQLEQAEADIALARRNVEGIVRVATFQTAAHTIIPNALHMLRSSHALLELSVSHVPAEKAISGLLARDFDIVLTEEYPGYPSRRPSGVQAVHAAHDQLWFVTPHADPLRELADAGQHRWVLEPEGTFARQWAVAACRTAGLEPRIMFETPDPLLQVRLIAAGAAIGFVPGLALNAAGTAGLHVVALERHEARTISIVQRRGSSRSPVLKVVRDALAKEAERQIDRATRHATH